MTRARLQVGEVGKITATDISGGKHRKYRATGRVRVTVDRVDQIKATAATAAEAIEKVREEAATRVSFAVTDALSPDTTVTELVEAMLLQLRNGTALNPVRPQTVDQYATVLSVLTGETRGGAYPTIGGLPLRQVTKQTVRRWLRDVSVISPAAGKRCKAVMRRAFDLAIDEGVDPWNGNPAERAPLKRAEKRPPKALTVADIAVLRRNVAAWQSPRKRTDLSGIVDMLIATGMRPGELFALRWDDVNLVARPATVTVAGTTVELKGKREAGCGVRRQPFGKSDAAFRTLALPAWASVMLMDRRVAASSEYVFPNEDGGLLNIRNIGTRWRAARGEEYAGVSLYDFRRTVATMLARGVSDAAAASQLGHGDVAVTHNHYIERATDAGDYTGVLDSLAP